LICPSDGGLFDPLTVSPAPTRESVVVATATDDADDDCDDRMAPELDSTAVLVMRADEEVEECEEAGERGLADGDLLLDVVLEPFVAAVAVVVGGELEVVAKMAEESDDANTTDPECEEVLASALGLFGALVAERRRASLLL